MGGVDLWKNEDEHYDNFGPQSMHDKKLEVVSISGTWHLGKLQVTRKSIHIAATAIYTSQPSKIIGFFSQYCYVIFVSDI